MDEYTELLAAMEDWSEANREYHKARDNYDGPSPDWALSIQRDAADRATKELRRALEAVIAQAVAKALANHKEHHNE